MSGTILWVLTNDVEFTAGWGKNPADRSDCFLASDSAYVQIVNRNRGLAAVLEQFSIPETAMLAWGCFRSMETAAELAGKGLEAERWRSAARDGLAFFSELLAKGHRLCPHPHYEKDLLAAHPDYRFDASRGTLERWRKWESGYYRYGGSFARALPQLGALDDPESRLGYLDAGRQWLAENLKAWSMAARTGGWDFGFTPKDKRLSEEAFRGNGLLANLDADLNLTMWRGQSAPPKPWNDAIYLGGLCDINARATDGREWGLVELAHCSGLARDDSWYDLNNLTLDELNRQVDLAVESFTREGVALPGVHVITAMCHAAGLIGATWAGESGGEFSKLRAHLEYLDRRYVQPGVIRPATVEASVALFLDQASARLCCWPARAERSGAEWCIDLALAGAPALAEPQVVDVVLPLHTVGRSGVPEPRVYAGEVGIFCRASTQPPWRVAFTVTPATRKAPWSIRYSARDQRP